MDAYELGMEMYLDGYPRSENPFKYGSGREMWFSGYDWKKENP